MTESMVVLITGASSGFGRMAATLLASKGGFRVFGTSRITGRGSGDGFEMLQLDVNSDQSVNSCVSALVAKEGKIDVLVNNAGYALTGGLEETSIEEAKAQFETNFFGAVRMTNAVLPDMRRRRDGRIIDICSVSATLPVPFEGYYSAAKAALLAYTEALRNEVRGFNIKVSAVEPGFFRTNIAGSRKVAARPLEDYNPVRERILSQFLRDIETGGDPKVVAETVLKIIESPSPRLRYAVGREKRYLLLKRVMPASVFESAVRRHWGIE
jgi:NAD(P)-dependent dehydrogenase (short-subunit alcohol dehydrogenase family)